MTIFNNFVRTYTDKTYKYTAQVNHKGIVIAFAMDDARRISYSVLDLENTQVKDKHFLDVNYWLDNPKEISFPNEIVQVGYAILPNVKMPLVKKGTREEASLGTLRPEEVDPFLSTTARFTAQASFQVLSDGKFIYLFRQAIDKTHDDMLYKKDKAGNFVLDKAQQKIPLVNETLLVDRYVLAGTELKLKMEVRYQRSRHKYNPQTNKDGLGAKDLEKKPFFEPTQELDFIRNLKNGHFNVLLLPTQVADLQRWQFFTHNSKTGLIDSFNVERANDGLFNTKGTQLYTSPDPQYQSSVLERQPGTDSFTGEPLIPIVSQSGYAESALNFDGQDDYVELPPDSIPKGNEITISFWAFGGENLPSCNSVLEALDANDVRVFNVHLPWDNNKIFFDCGGSGGNYDRLEKFANTSDFKGVWTYWAFTKNAATGEMKIYLNGQLWYSETGKTLTLTRATKVRLGSAASGYNYYNGSLDEVRIWNRCRSQSEIQADMNCRLVGDEPGLWAYYRFDEGFGDRLHDQTENAVHGSIQGATWIKSDAPIGDCPGLQRTSFSLQSGSERRNVTSGLSALLYHQQEKVATGYDRQEKPVKRNARVMLTLGTSSPSSTSTDTHFIAALDFAVSREGRIAQVPDNLTLPNLQAGNAANQDLDVVSRLQEDIANLKASINQLEIEIAALKTSTQRIIILEAQKARLEAEIKSLTDDLNNKKQNIFNYFCRIQMNGNANYYEADGNGNVSHQPRNDNAGQYWRFFFPGYLGGSYKLCPSNHLTTNSGQFYRGQERGLIYDGSFKVADFWYQVAGSWFITYQTGNQYSFSVGNGPSGTLVITKTDRATSIITDVENTLRNKQTELTNTINELNKLYTDRDKLKEKESKLALQKIQLENKETELELLRSGIQGEIALPMSLLHTDPCGLTVAGGLLNFAYTKDTPLLVNSATGNVALYFRGLDDQFFVTYYDTNTTKARYLLEVEIGKLSATARSAEPEYDRATFTITDSATSETCTLKIINQATGLEETWRNLPREVQQFSNILNGGASQPIFIGKLREPAVGKPIDSLMLSQKAKQTLPQGSILALGNRKVVVSEDTSATEDTIPITPANLSVPADTAIYLILYDYEAWTTNNRTSDSLRNGSLQFFFQPGSSSGNVVNSTASDSETTRSCQWVAESPGRALSFDGKDDYVGLGESAKLPQFDAKGDLTLETWVRPAQLAESCRVIHHNSAQSQYTLGIQSKNINCLSALEFDGVDDYIELPPASIPVGNEVTISFWAFGGPKQPMSNCVIYAVDANNKRTINIHLPWGDSSIIFDCGVGGSQFDRIGKVASASDFKGIWSHWAFTKNAVTGEMKIYLNGKLWHSGTGKNFSLPTTVKARLGCETGGVSYYNGSLDEVQIWNKALSDGEIQSNMNRRLVGNEAGLVGYWQFTGGIAKDYSPNGYNGTIFGQPSLVTSVIQESQIYSFAGVGNLFLKSQEAAPMAQWHHLAAVYNQSYALQFNGNSVLECDHNPTLDLDRDLTIETFLQVDTLGQRQGILTKGKLGDGTDQNVPYSLYIDTDGKIAFAFEDKQGKSYTYKSSETLRVGQFYKIAVTRQHQTEVKNQGAADLPNVIVNQWADIRFYVNQKAAGYEVYNGADLDRNSQKLEIGKTYQGSQPNYLKGAISELRLWNSVVNLVNLGAKINGQEKGLVAWWRLEENDGNIASDSKGENHAVIIAAQWIKNPDPQGSRLTLYQNGIPVPMEPFAPKASWGEKQFTLGGIAQNPGSPVPTNGLLVYLTGDSYKGGDRWDDLSGCGNYASKASNSAMPSVFSVSNYNGKNFKVMRFDSSGGMTFPDTLNLQKPFTAIIVDRYYGNTKGRTLQSRDNNWLLGKHAGNNACYLEGWIGNRYAATLNTFTISTVTLEGTSPNWYVDGVSKGNSGGSTAPGKLGLCKGGLFDEVGDADIAAILIWDRVLSEAERQKVEKWLGEQYGIPVNHAVKIGGCIEPFAGTMEEVRIWKVARTQEQIQDNLFGRIKGEKQDLISNYTFDLESQTDLFDQSLIGNHLALGLNEAKPMSVLSTAPISEDTAIIRSALAGVKTQFHDTIHCSPGVQEYSDLQYDIDGNLVGIQKRCYSYIKNGQWHLLTGYKVGNLITEWVGQVQADPQIIGYIEGAPPVPSENLTGTSVDMDPYDGTAIQLVESESVNYIYSSSKESGFDMSIEMVARLGFSQRVSGGIGLETEIADVTTLIGAKATFESSQGAIDEAITSYGYNTTKVSRLQTWGAWEKLGSEINSYVGRRYVPANVGLALVQSDTMDVFALRLAHNSALVSYRFLPNPDIPKDWNIITFPINPTYTKQGTLDGKVGLKEDGSVQPDPHYPNAANYGQWSYFKPIEAYSLKKRIERQRQEVATYYDQYSTFQNVSYQATGALDELRQKQIATRNLVNTYVWTADGGFFSESTDVMEATTETTTGFYSFQGMAGLSVDLNLKLGVATSFQIDALFGGHVATTKTKGRDTEKSFALEVEVDVERDIQLYALTDALQAQYQGQYTPEEFGVYDANGKPIKQPGKVDAYRFMTFYFEPTTENFEDFFGKVVDPIWLEQSSDPNAIALRQANQGGKKPSCWRVFHRVTFVSRILPEIAADNAPPLEKAIRAANIESNWELIKKLEPFVQTKTQDYVTFADAVRDAIATYLPELQGHEEAVIQYMALYLGLDQVI